VRQFLGGRSFAVKIKPVTQKNFLRGLVAVSGVLSQNKGSVPRASNLLLSKRGSLATCDGPQPLALYSGSLSSSRGRSLFVTYFSPAGVLPYLLQLAVAPDQHLGPPKNLAAADGGAGGRLHGPYLYEVTDG